MHYMYTVGLNYDYIQYIDLDVPYDATCIISSITSRTMNTVTFM